MRKQRGCDLPKGIIVAKVEVSQKSVAFLLPLTAPGFRSFLSASEAGDMQIQPSTHSQIVSEHLPTARYLVWHWRYKAKRKQACFLP